MHSNIIVRFAPSPTGLLHIGGSRTAFLNWIFAKKYKGIFILRIENTDINRSKTIFINNLITQLKWLNLLWNEGPCLKGNNYPYLQNKRRYIYLRYLKILEYKNAIFFANNAIWIKTSKESCLFKDVLKGLINIKLNKNFIIFKSNKDPIFHFTNVIDDIEMNISHIIRGEDHISNTSKHILIFNKLKINHPYFIHIPIILNNNGIGKMSKRNESSLISSYQNFSFLNTSIINYLYLLGLSIEENEKEIISQKEMIKNFKLKKININNCKFNEKKLISINNIYFKILIFKKYINLIQHKFLTYKNLLSIHKNKIQVLIYLQKKHLLNLQKKSYKYFNTIQSKYILYYLKTIKYIKALFYKKILISISIFHQISLKDWRIHIYDLFSFLNYNYNLIKKNNFLIPLRIAISQQSSGINLILILEILGKKTFFLRIRRFLSKYNYN